MTTKTKVKKGDAVAYKWGASTVDAKVTKVHTSDTERTIKGKTIKRKASAGKPAVEVTTKKGGKALKSTSEVKVKPR